MYLLLYAIGRYALEFFRGDIARGFIIEKYLSHSQLIALLIFLTVIYIYTRWSRQNQLGMHKKPI
jgi:phosphatidylglycerol:prolipoprotein diacylglycerol transferase